MKFVFLLFGLISMGYATPVAQLLNEEWIEFKMDYSKEYENEEEELFRMKVFLENRYKIAKHNQLYDQKRVSFRLAMNKFGDLLTNEFIELMNGLHVANVMKWDELEVPTWKIGISNEQINENITDAVDWRKRGAVTEVKDQIQCGSCYAFSATGALEGQNFLSTGKLVSLSEQNIVDCSGKYGNHGCEGGYMNKAFQYVKDNGGIDTEKSYPYRGYEQSSCKYNPKQIGATDCGYKNIQSGCEKCLTSAISSIGPISVGIDASHFSFQFYSKGIYYEPACSAVVLDHGVLAVGYGTDENGQDYWIIKNSWGTTWGESGYMRMARNRGNSCGIATMASYPLVCAHV